VRSGRFRPHVEAFGLKSGVVQYVTDPGLDSLIPSSLKARVQAAADSIGAGTLKAAPRPSTMEAAASARRRSLT
jgi:hypothetical protein